MQEQNVRGSSILRRWRFKHRHLFDSYDARTWPAAFVQFWFGDGAPNLDRDRPMLFEEVARMLMNREELEYSLSSDSESQPYRTSGQSRFNTPELVAVMGDVIRRLKLLKGTRASVQRSGFDSDVKALAAPVSTTS